MKTIEFIPVAEKLVESNIFPFYLKKGSHGKDFLGFNTFGTTIEHHKFLWRKYGTLENIVIFKTAEEANEILMKFNITEFQAKPTKSGTMCRLILKK